MGIFILTKIQASTINLKNFSKKFSKTSSKINNATNNTASKKSNKKSNKKLSNTSTNTKINVNNTASQKSNKKSNKKLSNTSTNTKIKNASNKIILNNKFKKINKTLMTTLFTKSKIHNKIIIKFLSKKTLYFKKKINFLFQNTKKISYISTTLKNFQAKSKINPQLKILKNYFFKKNNLVFAKYK